MEMLHQSNVPISEVAYHVGFGSVTYFNKCFHDYFGFPPGEASKKELIKNFSIDNPANKKKPPAGTKLYSIAAIFILIVLIQATIIYFVYKPFTIGRKTNKISIAVLPITNYNMNGGNAHIINGLRDNLISKLEIIEDLNVISRTTTDKYRHTNQTTKEISKTLKVDFILEGSAEKINDKIKIRLQLFETRKGYNLWAKPYVREITTDNVLNFQEEIALLVVNELNAVISSKEKEQITFLETENSEAYFFFLQGKDFMAIYERNEYSNHELEDIYFTYLEMAKFHFQKAIKLDSAYSQAYVFLGWYYHIQSRIHIVDGDKSNNYLDSALLMANKAISFHPHHSDGYDLQSCIFANKGMMNQATKSSDRIIEIDVNSWKTYYRIAENCYTMNLYANALSNFLTARKLNNEPFEDVRILRRLYSCLVQTGCSEEAQPFLELIFAVKNDSVEYYDLLSHKEFSTGNLDKALNYKLKACSLDTFTEERLLQLSIITLTLRDYDKMLHYFNKYQLITGQNDKPNAPDINAGYIYLTLGDLTESNYHFNQILANDLKRMEFGTNNVYTYACEYEMACIYSAQGEIDKALDHLQQYKNKDFCPLWLITSLKNNPMLDNVRGTEFKKVLKNLEYKYQKEHNNTKQFLIREGLTQQ
jgi:TolB-like protein